MQKYNKKSQTRSPVRKLSLVLLLTILIIILCFIFDASLSKPAYAYNTKGHHWINEKAIQYLQDRGSIVAKKFPLSDFLKEINWGSDFADGDYPEPRIDRIECTWSAPGIKKTFACDTLHHYGQSDIIETDYGVDIGNPGELTAPDYAENLFAQAIQFWPGGTSPSLDTLTEYEAGYATVTGIAPSHDLGVTWAGGLPLCSEWVSLKLPPNELFKVSDYCPKWPSWATRDTVQTPLKQRYRQAVESVPNALRYLGWALHMVEDMTIPHHALNRATPSHQEFEDRVDNLIRDEITGKEQLKHLPAPVGEPYPYKFCTSGGNCAAYHPVMPNYFDKIDLWTVKQFAEEAGRISTDVNVTDGFELKTEIQIERDVDLAIKLVAALMEKYFKQFILKPDQFEKNDTYQEAKRLKSGNYSNLSIDGPLDEDWYAIEVTEDYTDVIVELQFNRSISNLVAELQGQSILYPAQLVPNGSIIKATGLKKGIYPLHIYTADYQYPVLYNLKIGVSKGTLSPDEFEENDTPDKAKEFYTGCNPHLNIDRSGDDDYYYLNVASTDTLEVNIQFDPTQGELRLFLDNIEATEIQQLSSGEKIIRISRAGTGKALPIRVTGARNSYTMCASIGYCTVNSVYDCTNRCVNKEIALSRIGDGYCDNGQRGMDLRCDQFKNDGGDCYKPNAQPKQSCGSLSVYDCSGHCELIEELNARCGNGWCDDGSKGIDLKCDAFDNDKGDCDTPLTDNNTCKKAIPLKGGGSIAGNIEKPGEEYWYSVQVPVYSWLVVTTSGNTDTYGELYSRCEDPSFAADDNKKDGTNFALYTMGSGTYYIRVRHANPSGTGKYMLETMVKPIVG